LTARRRQGASLPFLFAALLYGAAALAQLPTVQLNAGLYLIRAEVAADYASRSRGLMHREALAPNAGMLFVFDEPAAHCMWMRNTLVALSVAFLDDGGEIINIADMTPHSEQAHCAARPARYALEMNRGWFAARGIKPGMRLGGIPGR
jgi:uncharacterized membrane protein (UPF0127 family)